METNPYESPISDSYPVTNQTTLRGCTARFSVATPRVHKVEVYMSSWTGLHTYHVDGQERLRVRWFWGLRTAHRFSIDQHEDHILEVRYTQFPIWAAPAYLNGALILEEVFPVIRGAYRCFSRLAFVLLVLVLLLLCLVIAAFIRVQLP